jgi:hypothetical protein
MRQLIGLQHAGGLEVRQPPPSRRDSPNPCRKPASMRATSARESERLPTSSDMLIGLMEDVEMGFARVYLHNVAWRHPQVLMLIPFYLGMLSVSVLTVISRRRYTPVS